jgi:hypothetical protein
VYLPASDKGGRGDVKNHDEDFTISRDKPALACGMKVLANPEMVALLSSLAKTMVK